MDEPGNKGAEEVSNLFPPGKIKKITLPTGYKDANDLLRDNKATVFLQALYNAKDIRSEGIISIRDIYDSILELPEYGKVS